MHRIFILLLVSTFLISGCTANTIHTSRMAVDRYIQLDEQANSWDWKCGGPGDAIPIEYNQFFTLKDKSLLVLLKVPDYLCYSNSFVPIRVSTKDDWQYGEIFQGEPTIFQSDLRDNFWLVTQWRIEGTYPSLLTSTDGLVWNYYDMPRNRDVDCCFEYIKKVCTRPDSITLFYEGERPSQWTKAFNMTTWRELEYKAADLVECEIDALESQNSKEAKWEIVPGSNPNEVVFELNGQAGKQQAIFPSVFHQQ